MCEERERVKEVVGDLTLEKIKQKENEKDLVLEVVVWRERKRGRGE